MDKPFALIIEDERDIATLFRHVIDIAGYRTEIAFHGQAAVERLSNSKPDIVILDLNLPGVSGKDILEMIRKDKRLDQTKIIVVTAHSYIADGLSVEPDLILLKPVSIEQLLSFMDRFYIPKNSQKTTPLQANPWDKSTGLYKKTFFMHRLDSSLRQSKEIEEYHFAVLSYTLDQKRQLGNKDWESVLRKTTESIKKVLRPNDTFARFDQGNFYILIENISNEDNPIQIATRIEEILNEKLVNIGYNLQTPITVNIKYSDSGYEKIEKILSGAKNA